jgi:hypothetical protein
LPIVLLHESSRHNHLQPPQSRKPLEPEPSYSNDENDVDPIIVIGSNDPMIPQNSSHQHKEKLVEKGETKQQQKRSYSQQQHFVAVPSVDVHTGLDGNYFDEISTLAYTYDEGSIGGANHADDGKKAAMNATKIEEVMNDFTEMAPQQGKNNGTPSFLNKNNFIENYETTDSEDLIDFPIPEYETR